MRLDGCQVKTEGAEAVGVLRVIGASVAEVLDLARWIAQGGWDDDEAEASEEDEVPDDLLEEPPTEEPRPWGGEAEPIVVPPPLRKPGQKKGASPSQPPPPPPETLGEETWRPVPWAEGYTVSSEGRARGKTGAALNTTPRMGYAVPVVNLPSRIRPKGSQTFPLAPVILEAFSGKPPAGGEAHYLDGNWDNCRLSNLAWRVGSEIVIPGDSETPACLQCGAPALPRSEYCETCEAEMRGRITGRDEVIAEEGPDDR